VLERDLRLRRERRAGGAILPLEREIASVAIPATTMPATPANDRRSAPAWVMLLRDLRSVAHVAHAPMRQWCAMPERARREKRYSWWRKYFDFWDHSEVGGGGAARPAPDAGGGGDRR
jgi:hypothetical protein